MEELQKLYDSLSREGYYTKSFEEFQEQYADPAYRDKVFGVVTRDGLYTKSREEFDAKYSPVKKKDDSGESLSVPQAPSGESESIGQRFKKGLEAAMSLNPQTIGAFLVGGGGDFSDRLMAVAEIADDVPLVGGILEAGLRGTASGRKQATITNETFDVFAGGEDPSDEDIMEYIQAHKEREEFIENYGPSENMQLYQQYVEEFGDTFWGSIKAFAKNPVMGVEVMAESFSGLFNKASLSAGGAVVGGSTLTGAGLGATAGGVGAVPGAVAGLGLGLKGGMGVASGMMETMQYFSEAIAEVAGGTENMTPEKIREILEDEDLRKQVRNSAVARGATIAAIEALGAYGLGKLGGEAVTVGRVTRTASKKGVKDTAVELGGEAGVGMLGEVGGITAANIAGADDEYSASEIVLEGIAELPTSSTNFISNSIKVPSYQLNGRRVSKEQLQDVVETATYDQLKEMKISIDNDEAFGQAVIDNIEGKREGSLVEGQSFPDAEPAAEEAPAGEDAPQQSLSEEVSQGLESIDQEIAQAQAEVEQAAERAGIDADAAPAQEAATQKLNTLRERKKEALRLIGEVGQAQEQTSDAEVTAATEAADFTELTETSQRQAELEGELRDLLGVKPEPQTIAVPDETGVPAEVKIEEDTQQPAPVETTQEEQLVDDFEEFDLDDSIGERLLASENVDTTLAEEVRTLQGSLKTDAMKQGKVVFHKTQESIRNVDEKTRQETAEIFGYMDDNGTLHLGPNATRNTVREEFAHKAFVSAIGQDSNTRAATFDSLIKLSKKNKRAEEILRSRVRTYTGEEVSGMSIEEISKLVRREGIDTAEVQEEAIMGLMIDYANDPSKYKSQKNWFIKAAQKILDTIGLGGTIKNENDVITLGKKLERATRGKQVDLQGDQTQAKGRMAKSDFPKGGRIKYMSHEYAVRVGERTAEYGSPRVAGPFNDYDHFANWYRRMVGQSRDGKYLHPERIEAMRIEIDGVDYQMPAPQPVPGREFKRYDTYAERQRKKVFDLAEQVKETRRKTADISKEASDLWRDGQAYTNSNFFDFFPSGVQEVLDQFPPYLKGESARLKVAQIELEAKQIQLENIKAFNELEITPEEMQELNGRGRMISPAKYPELFELSGIEHSVLAENKPEEQESARSTGRFAKEPSEVVSQKPTKKQLEKMEGRPNSVMGTLKGLIKGLKNPQYVAMAYDSSSIADKSGVAETKPDVLFSHRNENHAQATKEKIQAAIRADNTAPNRNRKFVITYFTQGKEYLHGNPEVFEQTWRQIMEAAESDPAASKQIREAVEDVLDFSKGTPSSDRTSLLNNIFLRLKSHPAVIVGKGKNALQRAAAKLHKNGVMKIKEKGLKLSIPDNNNLLAVFETLSNIRDGKVQRTNEMSFSKRNEFMKALLLNIDARKKSSRSRALKSIPSLSLSRAQFLDTELATARSGHAVAAKVIPAVSVNDVEIRYNPESAFPYEVVIEGFEQDLTYLQEWPNLSELDPKFQPEESAQAVRSSIRGRLDSGMAGRFSKGNPLTTMEYEDQTFEVRTKSRSQEKVDNFLRKLANKYREIELIQADVEKSKGRPVDESQDFKMAEELMYGKAATALENLDDKVGDITKIMRDNDITEQDITDYLYALHAPERNALLLEREGVDNGSGISDQDAQEIVDEVAQSGKLEAYDQVAEKIQAIAQDTRDTMRKLGLETDARIDSFEAMFNNYVPLAGIAIDESGKNVGTYPDGGVGFHVSGSRIKKAEGRKTPAINLFAQTVHMNAATHVRGQKNEVMRALYNLIKDNPNKEVWNVFDPEKKGEKRSLGNLDVVGVRVDGKQMAIQFADPSHAETLRGMGIQKTNTFLKLMRGLSGWLRRSYTTLRPEFAINNFVRDSGSAVFNAAAEAEIEGGMLNGQGVIKDMMKMVPSSLSAFLKDAVGKDSDPLIKKYFEEFKEDGGRTGWGYIKSIEQIQEEILRETSEPEAGMRGMTKKLFGKIEDTADFVEGVNEAFENSIRMAAYVAARKNGISRAKSAQFAKNVTVNFNKQGEYGQVLNAVYLFFNAGVQGTARFARSMVSLKPKKKADGTLRKGRERITTPQKLAGSLVLFNSMLTAINIALSDRDDDDELFYNKIPDYVKERAMIIMVDGENYIKIPMPYGYNIFANMGSSMTEVATGNRKPWSGVTFMANSIMTSFSPMSFGQSKDLITSISKGAVPTPFKPIVDILANETYFGGKVHAEQSPFGAPKPESELAFRSPEGVQRFFRWMNEATGGSEEVSGSLDFNPDRLYYLFEYAIGGVGRDITRGAETARKLSAKTKDSTIDIEFNDIAMMRALYGEPSKYYDFELYADRRDQIVQLSREYKKLTFKQRKAKGDRYDGLRRLDRELKKAERELKKIRAKRREARKEKDYTTRTSMLQRLFEEERKVLMEFNRIYSNVKGET